MDGCKVYVGNLSYAVASQDLQDAFARFGDITEAKVITDRETGRSKGFGFVTFGNQEAAQSSLTLNGTDLQGRNIKVNIANDERSTRAPSSNRFGGGGGGGGGRSNFGGGGHRSSGGGQRDGGGRF